MKYSHRMIVNSPLGEILVQGTDSHIQYLKFTQANDHGQGTSSLQANWTDPCRQQLQQYFSGERCKFDLPIDAKGSEFQKSVWRKLCDIDFGGIASYQQIALGIGNAKAVRAVASANAGNPIWLIIPCHRVVGSDSALRGYAGGIVRKAKLLAIEGMSIDCEDLNRVNEKTKLVLKDSNKQNSSMSL